MTTPQTPRFTRRADGRYVATLTTQTGSRRFLYARTEEDLEAKLALARQREPSAAAARMTLGRYLDDWWDEIEHSPRRQKTRESYAWAISHLRPGLGRVPIAALNRRVCQTFFSALGDNLAGSSIRQLRRILGIILTSAREDGYLTHDPLKRIVLPDGRATAPQPTLDRELVRLLLKGLRDQPIYPLIVTTIAAGLRQGEVCGLRWDDVDLEHGIVTVRHQAQRVDGKLRLVPVKTRGSADAVHVGRNAVEVLVTHQRAQQAQAEWMGRRWHWSGTVFTTETGGLLAGTTVYKQFQRALKAVGLPPMRFHTLRHGHSGLLAQLNIHPAVMAASMRHADPALTLRVYTEADTASRREAAAALDRVLEVG